MREVTITLNDDSKFDELLQLVTALPYVESTAFDDPGEEISELRGQSVFDADANGHADDERSPFYQDPKTQVMDQEIAAFDAMKVDLLVHHLDEFVAIFQGAVVDHDPDKALLLGRLAQTHPHEFVLIRQVRRTPRPPFRLRSPPDYANHVVPGY